MMVDFLIVKILSFSLPTFVAEKKVPRTGGPNKGSGGARWNRERKAVQDRPVWVVAKGHIFEGDFAFAILCQCLAGC